MLATPDFGTLNYTILIVYMLGMMAIGWLFAGKQHTTEDFFLAGRNMPWLVVGMSMFASLTSATSFMGIPGTAYSENVSLIGMGVASLILTPILIFVFYPFYRVLNVTTSYEYVLNRFGQPARFTVSALFLMTRLGWLGVVLYAPAMTLNVVTGVNLPLSILLMGVLATSYTAMGGLSAVLWTDLAQFCILITGAVWVSISLATSVPDGILGIIEIASQTDHLINWEFSLYEMTALVVCFSFFFQLMHDYGIDQVTVQRLMAIRSFKGMAWAAIFNSLCDFLIVALLLFVGLGLFSYYQSGTGELVEGITGDRVLPYYIMQTIPPGFSGLLITAIFAAAMSSMDSGINSMSTVVICDFVRPLRKQKRPEQSDLNLARMLTLLFGLIATLVAFYVASIEQILRASTAFLGLFGGPILALFLLGMITRRANFKGWLVSLFVALPATFWLQHATEVHFIYYFPFCFLISTIVGYVASILIGSIGKVTPANRQLTVWGLDWTNLWEKQS